MQDALSLPQAVPSLPCSDVPSPGVHAHPHLVDALNAAEDQRDLWQPQQLVGPVYLRHDQGAGLRSRRIKVACIGTHAHAGQKHGAESMLWQGMATAAAGEKE